MIILVDNIKNVSDVITNSSTEVFVMKKSQYKALHRDKECRDTFWYKEITWEFVKTMDYQYETLCDICGIDKSFLDTCYTSEDWDAFLELYHDVIQEKLIGKYWISIDDHLDVDGKAISAARENSYYYCGRQ